MAWDGLTARHFILEGFPAMQFYDHIIQVIQSSLQKSPEAMLGDCLAILIELSGASGGSILGEEGPHLQFLYADLEPLIGEKVPWDSIAGATTRQGVIIYTYAPSDERHYDGIDEKIARTTRYLLSIPIPSVHRSSDAKDSGSSAGALQLLFDRDILPAFDVTAGPKEFGLDELREQASFSDCLREVFWILPNMSFALEVMKLRQTSYQAIHELKNKMISASSWLNCLKEDIEDMQPGVFDDEDITEDFSLAQSSISEGANLAKSYLQFTKLYTPHLEAANVNDVLRETAASVRAFASEQGSADFNVVTDLDEAVAERQVDPNHLRMAFFNLGKNATEALLEYGTEQPRINISSRLAGARLTIEIADNGPGMPPEIADSLFVPFKTKKEGGTGLGLTITKKIVEVHGGTIQCSSSPEGTRFTITL